VIFHLFVRRAECPTVSYLQAIWPDPFGLRIEPVRYDEIDRFTARPGLYIFSDTDLMDDVTRRRAAELHARLKTNPSLYRVWNDPVKTARRFDVLDRLRRDGVNRFRAFRVGEPLPADLRYPVFVRDEHAHKGPLTPLLTDEAALRAAITELRARARPVQPLLIVEHIDYASADGVYRKYSIFRAGDRLIRKHLLFAGHWVLKEPQGVKFDSPEWLQEERDFLDEKSHDWMDAEVKTLFERLAVDYGRIDFTVMEGRLQVFEINTNPIILRPMHLRPDGPSLAMHRSFDGLFQAALKSAECGGGPSLMRRIEWSLHRPWTNPTPWWRRLVPGWRERSKMKGNSPCS
jgi:hypothetical protein